MAALVHMCIIYRLSVFVHILFTMAFNQSVNFCAANMLILHWASGLESVDTAE